MRSQSIMAGLCVLALTASAGAQQKVSERFNYSGYTSADWKSFSRSAAFVTMKDGTRIAVDVVLPTEYVGSGTAQSKFPVIFQYSPYGRSHINLKTGDVPVAGQVFLQHGY